MKGPGRGIALYLLLAAVIFMVIFTAGSKLQQEDTYSHEQFGFDLESGTVAAVNVKPYNKTPTGQAEVTLKNGRVKTLYVADVSELMPSLLNTWPIVFRKIATSPANVT